VPPELKRIEAAGYLEVHFKPYRIIYDTKSTARRYSCTPCWTAEENSNPYWSGDCFVEDVKQIEQSPARRR
jgi:hypothetical protein